VMPACVLKELANASNDRFVAAGLERVVPNNTNTEIAVGDDFNLAGCRRSMVLGILANSAVISSVLLVGREPLPSLSVLGL